MTGGQQSEAMIDVIRLLCRPRSPPPPDMHPAATPTLSRGQMDPLRDARVKAAAENAGSENEGPTENEPDHAVISTLLHAPAGCWQDGWQLRNQTRYI